MSEVEFNPKAVWQGERCLFCGGKATLQADYGCASVRCCGNKECKDHAVDFAKKVQDNWLKIK